MNINDTKPCFSSHMGTWLIEPEWFNRAVASIQSGLHAEAMKASGLKEKNAPDAEIKAFGEQKGPFAGNPDNVFIDGIAIIGMHGAMMKGASKFGDTVSTIQVRRQLRDAVADQAVTQIILSIDSPGGHVAGTKELADDVRIAAQSKTVIAQIEDLGASAALWVASQATKIYANATAEVGSIGVVAVLHDTSKAFEREGVKVIVVSTGEKKGAGAAGTEITESIIADVQSKVDALNKFFVEGVATGRNLSVETVQEIATGETFLAEKALELGLIDAVQSMDATLEQIQNQGSVRRTGQRTAALKQRLSMVKAQSRIETVKNSLNL